MSTHSGADGLVQAELPPTSPEILTVFTSLACSPRRTSRVGEDCRLRTTWRPLTLAGRPALLLCVSLEVSATPTRRYHGRMLLHPSSPACATRDAEVIAHTQVRDPRESAAACYGPALGTPIHLAIHCIASVGNYVQVHTSVLNLIFQQAKVAGVGNLSKWRSEICSRCWSAP